MRYIWQQLPPWAKNSYFLMGLAFLVWMLFFDSEDLITQYRLRSKLSKLEAEKTYYQEQIEQIKRDKEELVNNEDLLEKFAREKYFMKKEKEDLYIVVDE
ncbi:MAG: septum formation initiator family protein [Bacteroidota bacterium]